MNSYALKQRGQKGAVAEGDEGDGETAAHNISGHSISNISGWGLHSTETICGPKPAWEYLDGQLMRDWVSPSASTWRDQSVPWFALRLD